jgi:hypothetical protein
MLRLAWLWYAIPLFAGGVLVVLGHTGGAPVRAAVPVVLIAVAFAAGIGWLNVLAARKIEGDRDGWFGPGGTA